jgi:hypothetical protein
MDMKNAGVCQRADLTFCGGGAGWPSLGAATAKSTASQVNPATRLRHGAVQIRFEIRNSYFKEEP